MINSTIENYFNQIKTYIKNRIVNSFEELEKNFYNAIEMVKPENYKKYVDYAYYYYFVIYFHSKY